MGLSSHEVNVLWNKEDEVELFDSVLALKESPTFCRYAREFADWADELCSQMVENPSIVGVNQAMLMLTKKYFEWYSIAPKRHRHRLGNKGHICIFQVFLQFYQRLKTVELSLSPPMLFQPPQAQIAGIFLGEEIGEEE